MQPVVIEHQPSFSDALCQRFGGRPLIDAGLELPDFEALIQQLLQEYLDNRPESYLININLKLKDRNLIDSAGAEILYRLRLAGIFAPVLMYTYEDISAVLRRHPEQTLLFSPGIRIAKLPGDFDGMPLLLTKAASDRVDNQGLMRYLQIEPRMNAIKSLDRHEMANLLGMLQIAQVAKERGDLSDAALSRLANYMQHQQKKFSPEIKEYMSLHQFSQPMSSGFTPQADSFEKIPIPEKPFQILYIDDHWQDGGWGEFLREWLAIEGEWTTEGPATRIKDAIFSLSCLNLSELDELTACLSYQAQTSRIKTDLVLLDLNLLGAREAGLAVEQRSGYQLLQWLNQKDPSLPVIMFTGSDQARTLETLQNNQIIGYVTKQANSIEAVREYAKLSTLLKQTIQSRYLRLMWDDLCAFSRQIKTDDVTQWQEWFGKHEAKMEIEILLTEAYGIMLGWSRRNNSKPSAANPLNLLCLQMHHIFELYYLKEIKNCDGSTCGDKIKSFKIKTKDKAKFELQEDLFWYLNRLRNCILHEKYQASFSQAIFAWVVVLTLLLKQTTVSNTELARTIFQAHLSDSNTTDKWQRLLKSRIYQIKDLSELFDACRALIWPGGERWH
ncbi:MAG: hypothetical protein IV090_17065 [Candidatus Sericytochromatia bacterium]|nr:hypothetical protein [Candidatus Sericytochromatia bacterium]